MSFYVRRGLSTIRLTEEPWHIESDRDSRLMLCGEEIGYRDSTVRGTRPPRVCERCVAIERNLSRVGEAGGMRYGRSPA